MSRGGRAGGGFRGGRGGFAGGKQRIGGQEVSWDFDPDLVIETKPQEMFPDIEFPKARPPSQFEKASAERYRNIRRRIQEGPFYTVLGENVRISKGAPKRAAEFNPFEDMPTYTKKYKPPLKKLAKFDTRKYQLQFFPQELWSTIDPKRRDGAAPEIKKPARTAGANQALLDELEEEKEKPEDEDEAPKADDDEEPEEENPDDNFSDDDDEMGEDYDAEKYFDGGEDDAGDAMDGDGGDDGGDY